MSNGAFLLVLIALGFVMLAYFNRRSRNYRRRHPGEDNPIDRWLTGREDGGRSRREDRGRSRQDGDDRRDKRSKR